MRRLSLLLSFALVAATTACSSAGGVSADIALLPPGPGDFDLFFDSLSPYGTWMDIAPWGEVWVPDDTPAGWRPYTEGRWVYSDDGWDWISDFDWGWAPFHYGRWADDSAWGWVWVPGNVWGPAWVAWRYGDDFVGWAPLPPAARWIPGVGLDTDFDPGRIPHRAWMFVHRDDFVRPLLRDHIVPTDRDDLYLHETRNATRYGIEGDRVIDHGVDPARIEEGTHHPIERYRLVPGSEPRGGIYGRELHIYRPEPGRYEGSHRQEARQEGRARAPFARGHIEEQRRLAARQAQERRALEERDQGELGHTPAARAQEVYRRQEEERRSLQARQEREREQERERYRQELVQRHLMTEQERQQRVQAEQHRVAAEHARGSSDQEARGQQPRPHGSHAAPQQHEGRDGRHLR